jgi:LysM repeat protein
MDKPVVPLNRAALKTVLGIEKAIPFALFYDKFGLGIAQMRDYNPGLRTDLIPYMGKLFSFNLPVEIAGRYEKSRDSIPLWLNGVPRMEITYDTITQVFDGDSVELVEPVQAVVTPTPLASREDKVWVYYKVKRGDAVYTITDVFDCNVADMRRWNNLNSRMVLIAGKRLKFYVPAQKKKYYQQIDRMTMAQKRERAKSNN